MNPHSEAEVRLRIAVQRLGIDVLFSDMLLRATTAIPTACWGYNRLTQLYEIRVNEKLCLELPIDELQALLLHEVYHHVGVNDLAVSLPFKDDSRVLNLVLDIALECAMRDGCYGDALRRLNDRLFAAVLVGSAPIRPVDSLFLLVHAAPPLYRMPEDYVAVWNHLWSVRPVPSPTEVYQQLRPLVTDEIRQELQKREQLQHVLLSASGDDAAEFLPRQLSWEATPIPVTQSLADAFAAHAGVQPGWKSSFSARQIEVHQNRQLQISELRAWLCERLQSGPAHRHSTAPGMSARIVRRPFVIRPTRGEITRRALKWPTVHYSNKAPQPSRVLPVYVDVSSSMSRLLPDVMSVLKAVRDLLPVDLFLFDTLVRPHPAGKALRGDMFVGGETSFDAVFEHAMAQLRRGGDHHIFVFTDGDSWIRPEVLQAATAQGLHAHAILFGPQQHPQQPWWSSQFRFQCDQTR